MIILHFETWYVDVIRQGDIKNVIKRGGHRACFYSTMLTNTVIKVTFGDLCAQQINAIISNAACYITTSSAIFDCLFIYVPEKLTLNTLHY